jgi:CHAT domain-containing protein
MRNDNVFVKRVSIAFLITLALLLTLPTALVTEAFQQLPTQQTPAGETNDVTPLVPNKRITRTIDRGNNHFYEFTLDAGIYIHAVVEQQGIDLSISIYDNSKNLVAEVDRANGAHGPEAISMIAPKDGVYRLRVHGGRANAPKPSYEISMENPRRPTPDDMARVKSEKLTFDAGDHYLKSLEAAQRAEKVKLLNQSITEYKEARNAWHSLKDAYEEGLTLYGIGWCYSDLGSQGMVKFPLPLYRLRWSYEARADHLSAIAYFKQSLIIMQTLGDEHGQSITLAGLAWPNLYLGNEKEAIDDFSAAFRLFEITKNLDGQARTLYGLGWAQAVLNNNSEALANFSKALTLRQAINDKRGEAITLASLGRMYSRLGNEQQALTFSERARELFESKALHDSHGVASTLTSEGWSYYGLKQYLEASDSFQKALKLRDEQDITGKAVALYGMARVESQRGKLEEAVKLMKQVIEAIGPLRRPRGSTDETRAYYFANVQEYYSFYTELLMRLHRSQPKGGYAEVALLNNEQARAREMVAILTEALPDAPNEDNLESKALTSGDIRHLLDDDTVLLEYALTGGNAYLWTVTAQPMRAPAIQGYDLPVTTTKVTAAAVSLIEMLKEKGGTIQEFEREATSLSRILIPDRAASEIRAKRKIVIVADGVLQYFPFATLSVSKQPKLYTPLVANHEVLTVPSASTLEVLRRRVAHRTPAPNSIAVIADPVFKSNDARVMQRADRSSVIKTQSTMPPATNRGEPRFDEDQIARTLVSEGYEAAPFLRLKRLRSTRDEAEMIQSLEPTARLELDFDAKLKTVTEGSLASYRMVHFATHGIAIDDHPEASGIFLSMVDESGEPQDGYLYFARVCGLRLPVELVVLSGCETNLGKDIRGEGLIGLTRGFMYAGASRVVASLWEVRGDATKELMRRFYTAMLREGKRPAAALSFAQGSMWKEQKWTPSDWAGFTYSGEWRKF